MSRLSSDPSTTPGDALTIMHWVGDVWCCLTYRPTGHGIEVISTETLSDEAADRYCQTAQTSLIRVVLPAAAVLVRSVSLGHGDLSTLEHQLAQASEDAFGQSVSPHRTAVAMQPATPDDHQRFGIALAWPPERSIKLPTTDSQQLLAVPDIVGLLAAMSTARPDLPLLWHDSTDGSTAMVLAGMGRVSARSTQLESGDDANIRRFVLESALQAGWSADEARSLGEQLPASTHQTPQLMLPDSVSEQMRGRCMNADDLDLNTFGIALGCALASTSDLATLTALRPTLPEVTPSRSEVVIQHMSRRRTAMQLVIALVLLIVLGPIIINGLQLAILSMGVGDLEPVVDQAAEVEQRQRLYAQLTSSSLPITKLLADIGAATPIGVTLDNIRLSTGEPARLRGAATAYNNKSAADLIADMKDHLQLAGIFSEVTVEWGERSNLGEREFTMTAAIKSATYRPRYAKEQDFGAWTLQQRKHKLPTTAEGGPSPRPSLASKWVPQQPGESSSATPATSTPTSSPGTAVAGTTTPDVPHRPSDHASKPAAPLAGTTTPPTIATGGSNGSGPSSGVSVFSGGSSLGGGSSASDTGSLSVSDTSVLSGDLSAGDMGAIPEILTDEQIATLTKAETKAKINDVSAARSRPLDEATDAALKDYFSRLFKHLRSIPREDAP